MSAMTFEEWVRGQQGQWSALAIDAWHARDPEVAELQHEKEIVNRIWECFGNPSYEGLKGKSIYDLVNQAIADQAQLAAATLRIQQAEDALKHTTEAHLEVVVKLQAEIAEHESSFKLRWDSDMRAIKRWQEATGKNLTWPDHADLCIWLLGQLAEAQKTIEGLRTDCLGFSQCLAVIAYGEGEIGKDEYFCNSLTDARTFSKAQLEDYENPGAPLLAELEALHAVLASIHQAYQNYKSTCRDTHDTEMQKMALNAVYGILEDANSGASLLAELTSLREQLKQQRDFEGVVSNITCCNGKKHPRFNECLYCAVDVLRERVKRADALVVFTKHNHFCMSFYLSAENFYGPCTCGLDAALAAYREGAGKEPDALRN